MARVPFSLASSSCPNTCDTRPISLCRRTVVRGCRLRSLTILEQDCKQEKTFCTRWGVLDGGSPQGSIYVKVNFVYFVLFMFFLAVSRAKKKQRPSRAGRTPPSRPPPTI